MSQRGIDLIPGLDFTGIGKAGVYLFFVLSAFLLSWQALDLDRLKATSLKYWVGYGVRRVLRIYPLYLVVLILSLVVTLRLPGYTPTVGSVTELIEHLALLAGNNIFWTVPVEFKYYLLLPFVTLAFFFASRIHWSLCIGIALASLIAIHFLWPPGETEANSISLGPYLGIFVLGSLSAVFYTDAFKEALKDYKIAFSVAGWLAVLVVMLTVPSLARLLFDNELTNQHFHRFFVMYGIIWSIAILAAMHGTRIYVAVFETAPLRFLGKVSFSAYLLHFPVIQLFSNVIELHASLEFVLAFGTILLISWISYRVIEYPFITWSHKTTDNWRN